MTDSAHLIAFGHPAVDACTARAGDLLDQAAAVTAEVGNSNPANHLSVALQSLTRACEARGYTLAEVLAGLAGAMGWSLTSERSLDARAAILNVTLQTVWQSALNGDQVEASFNTEPQGRA